MATDLVDLLDACWGQRWLGGPHDPGHTQQHVTAQQLQAAQAACEELRSQLQATEAERNTQAQAAEDLRHQLATAAAATDVLKEQLAESQAEAQALGSQLAAGQELLVTEQQTCALLRERLESTKQQVIQLEEAGTKAEAERDAAWQCQHMAEEELAAAGNALSALRDQSSSLECDLQRTQCDLSAARCAQITAETQLSGAQKKVSQLTEQVARLAADKEQVTSALLLSQSDLEHRTQEVLDLRRQLQQLTTERDEALGQLSSNGVRQVRQELVLAKTQITTLEQQLEDLRQRHTLLLESSKAAAGAWRAQQPDKVAASDVVLPLLGHIEHDSALFAGRDAVSTALASVRSLAAQSMALAELMQPRGRITAIMEKAKAALHGPAPPPRSMEPPAPTEPPTPAAPSTPQNDSAAPRPCSVFHAQGSDLSRSLPALSGVCSEITACASSRQSSCHSIGQWLAVGAHPGEVVSEGCDTPCYVLQPAPPSAGMPGGDWWSDTGSVGGSCSTQAHTGVDRCVDYVEDSQDSVMDLDSQWELPEMLPPPRFQ